MALWRWLCLSVSASRDTKIRYYYNINYFLRRHHTLRVPHVAHHLGEKTKLLLYTHVCALDAHCEGATKDAHGKFAFVCKRQSPRPPPRKHTHVHICEPLVEKALFLPVYTSRRFCSYSKLCVFTEQEDNTARTGPCPFCVTHTLLIPHPPPRSGGI